MVLVVVSSSLLCFDFLSSVQLIYVSLLCLCCVVLCCVVLFCFVRNIVLCCVVLCCLPVCCCPSAMNTPLLGSGLGVFAVCCLLRKTGHSTPRRLMERCLHTFLSCSSSPSFLDSFRCVGDRNARSLPSIAVSFLSCPPCTLDLWMSYTVDL